MPPCSVLYQFCAGAREGSEEGKWCILDFLLSGVGAFVEANDAGYTDAGAFEVGDGTRDPIEADTDGLEVMRLARVHRVGTVTVAVNGSDGRKL